MIHNPWESLKEKPWELTLGVDEIRGLDDPIKISSKSAYLKGIQHALEFLLSEGMSQHLFRRAIPFIERLDSLE